MQSVKEKKKKKEHTVHFNPQFVPEKTKMAIRLEIIHSFNLCLKKKLKRSSLYCHCTKL